MNRKEIVSEYSKLKKKYNLPPLDKVENSLFVYFNEPNLFVRVLIDRLLGRLNNHVSYMASLFQPQQIFQGFESKFLSQKEKDDLFDLFKTTLANFYKLRISIYELEKNAAKIFNEVYEFYLKDLLPKMKKLDKFMAKEWTKKSEEQESPESHFG